MFFLVLARGRNLQIANRDRELAIVTVSIIVRPRLPRAVRADFQLEPR
jgi:hypothetical protein